jgi:sterol desaturase/sphingolipid hydroxylase (fatty acid hydroxylase superfamily)
MSTGQTADYNEIVDVFRRVARWASYPAILGGSVWGVTALGGRVPLPWAIAIVNVAAGLAVVATELAIPYRARWRQSHGGDVQTDLAYLAGSAALVLIATTPLTSGFAAAALWIGRHTHGGLWPRHWPLAAQLTLALLIYELGSYLFHRLSHHSWLWRLHSVHHSVRRLHGLNAIRSHPIDFFFAVATTSGPLLLLGVDEMVFAQVTVFGTVNMWLQHANADMKTGWLDWIFVTPALHRWHHSQVMGEQQRNLGAVLIVWDVAFGTRLLPRDREPPERAGTGHPERYPDTFVAQLAAPFRRRLWSAA